MRKPNSAGKKPKYRTITLYIRDDETLEEYMENARDGYFAEEEMKKLMSEPQIPAEDLLRELEVINAEEKATPKKKKMRTPPPSKKR